MRNFVFKMWKVLTLFLVLIGTFVPFLMMPILAAETCDEQEVKLDLITIKLSEIRSFYLHRNAAIFMVTFYTSESLSLLVTTFNEVENLYITNQLTELPLVELENLYQQLNEAINGLRPIIIRRGEAVASYQYLNFRDAPARDTRVIAQLPYGTAFEIIDEVYGGVVINNAGTRGYRWVRIRHDGQIGYVHSWYVRNLPITERRVQLIADVRQQELRVQSLIEGWNTDYALVTITELTAILGSFQNQLINNWQFDLTYAEFYELLNLLNYDHVNFITQQRYNLINQLLNLFEFVTTYLSDNNYLEQVVYTDENWELLNETFNNLKSELPINWDDTLSDYEIQEIYETLRVAFNALERRPRVTNIYETNTTNITNQNDSFDIPPILIWGAIGLGLLLLFSIGRRIYNSLS